MFIFIEKNPKKILAIVAIFFALVYSVLAIRSGLVFNSPDENANYFFSSLFMSESRLDYPLPTDSDIIHPRSMTISNQKIVPQSFIGMPILYGILGKIFGSNAIIFFTPIIAVISVLFFYEVIKKIFGAKNAFLSSILVFIHPSFWYYSTHSMYHNVLFLSLLIIGMYFFRSSLSSVAKATREKIQYKNLILGSMFVGLSLAVRTCEIPWVVLVLIILFYSNKKKISFKKAAVCLFVFFILSLPIFFLNSQLYGSALSSGYNLANGATPSVSISPIKSLASRSVFFSIIRNFWNYGVYIFWWLNVPAFLGIFWILKNYKKLKSGQKKYLAVFGVGLIYLIIYYGSWVFHDNPDPTKITIGTSYVRYWLPIYIFSTPFLATLLLKIKNLKKAQKIGLFLMLAFLISYNFLFVFKLADENIGRNVLGEYKAIREKVLNLTEDNAIIVAGYYDKLFFPHRLVIENFNEEREKRLKEIGELLEKDYPIYYYSWNSDADILYLNNIFKKYNLKLINSINIRQNERLFEFVRID